MAKSAAQPALRRVPAALALIGGAALLVGGCSSSTTYGTGQAPEMAVFSELAGVGGLKKKEPITYKPRSPLVMPPEQAELRPPVDEPEVRTAQWPGSGQPNPGGNVQRPNDPHDNNARDDLTPEYVASLKPLGALSQPRSGGIDDTAERINAKYEVIGNDKARRAYRDALADAKGIGSTERRYLTDPPEKYRQPAEGAPVDPDGVTSDDGNFVTRLFR
ncbi:hypothetical protein [Afifella pfennigii]|uniref:hypothetical protein n=1 Tax=Afifella pfennigii TaxID=209897 RepID=UPI00047EA6DA|nr:hypothetical protein [Afifella pfennigii]